MNMKMFLILAVILLAASSTSWAKLEYHEDIPVVPGKLEKLNKILDKGVHVEKVHYTERGFRDGDTAADVSYITFELRYVFLNDEQKKKFEPWQEHELDTLFDTALDDWIYDNGIPVDGAMTREMVYSLTKLAREQLKDYPLYVVGFQPVNITFPVFQITEPGVVMPGDGYTHDDGPIRKIEQ